MSAQDVVVEFVNAETGQRLRPPEELPARALPPRFGVHQSLELGGQPWAIVQAWPATRAKARVEGRVKLVLRPLTGIPGEPPDQRLFSVPTLADTLPVIDPTPPADGARLLELHEDEWRQIEVVSPATLPRVQEALGRIQRVRDEAQPAPEVFRRMYLREHLGPPLKGRPLPLNELLDLLPPGTTKLDGLQILGADGLVKDGLALETMNGLQIYGHAPRGEVKVLGLLPPLGTDPDALGAEALALSSLLLRFGVQLVDWCRAELVEADADAITRLLAGPSAGTAH